MTTAKARDGRILIGRCGCGQPGIKLKQGCAVCAVCDDREKRGREMRRNPGTGRRA